MANTGQGELGDLHDTIEPTTTKDADEVIIGGGGHKYDHGGARGPNTDTGTSPNGDGEDTDDKETESINDNNDQAPGNPVGVPHGPRGHRGGCAPERPSRSHKTSGSCLYETTYQMSYLFGKVSWRYRE